jgi:hypothetical protein
LPEHLVSRNVPCREMTTHIEEAIRRKLSHVIFQG